MQPNSTSKLLVRFAGRLDSSFEDRNEDLVQGLLARHPNVGSFEMETFQLLHLARLCRKSTVHVSAASIVVRGKLLPLRDPFVRRKTCCTAEDSGNSKPSVFFLSCLEMSSTHQPAASDEREISYIGGVRLLIDYSSAAHTLVLTLHQTLL